MAVPFPRGRGGGGNAYYAAANAMNQFLSFLPQIHRYQTEQRINEALQQSGGDARAAYGSLADAGHGAAATDLLGVAQDEELHAQRLSESRAREDQARASIEDMLQKRTQAAWGADNIASILGGAEQLTRGMSDEEMRRYLPTYLNAVEGPFQGMTSADIDDAMLEQVKTGGKDAKEARQALSGPEGALAVVMDSALNDPPEKVQALVQLAVESGVMDPRAAEWLGKVLDQGFTREERDDFREILQMLPPPEGSPELDFEQMFTRAHMEGDEAGASQALSGVTALEAARQEGRRRATAASEAERNPMQAVVDNAIASGSVGQLIEGQFTDTDYGHIVRALVARGVSTAELFPTRDTLDDDDAMRILTGLFAARRDAYTDESRRQIDSDVRRLMDGFSPRVQAHARRLFPIGDTAAAPGGEAGAGAVDGGASRRESDINLEPNAGGEKQINRYSGVTAVGPTYGPGGNPQPSSQLQVSDAPTVAGEGLDAARSQFHGGSYGGGRKPTASDELATMFGGG